jgi:antirestriction protein ArdC
MRRSWHHAGNPHAAYIASWLKVMKDDKRAIFTAASHALIATSHEDRRPLARAPARGAGLPTTECAVHASEPPSASARQSG